MEKKEPLKKNAGPRINQDTLPVNKPSFLSNRVFDIIKLILGICLLPLAYSTTVSFLDQVSYVDLPLQNYLWAGVASFLLVYLFIFEPGWVYDKGHKLLEVLFSFLSPLVKVAPYLLPIYAVTVFVIYLLLAVFIKENWLINYTMFLFGASLALHLVFSSKAIRSKKGDILKSNYIFGFSFVYIVNLWLIALFLSILLPGFSFFNFCEKAYFQASGIFKAVFSQLFKV